MDDRIHDLEFGFLTHATRIAELEAAVADYKTRLASTETDRDNYRQRVDTVEKLPATNATAITELDKRLKMVEGAIGSAGFKAATAAPKAGESAAVAGAGQKPVIKS